jgi:hypothetical protein
MNFPEEEGSQAGRERENKQIEETSERKIATKLFFFLLFLTQSRYHWIGVRCSLQASKKRIEFFCCYIDDDAEQKENNLLHACTSKLNFYLCIHPLYKCSFYRYELNDNMAM